MVFWLQLLSCRSAGCNRSQRHHGAVGRFAAVVLAERADHSQAGAADVGAVWVQLAVWQLLTEALVQNPPVSRKEFHFPESLILLLRKLLGKHQ